MITIVDDVLPVLSTLELDGKAARIVDQLDRKLYLKIDKILQALGGKWSRSAKAHLFPSNVRPIVDLAITTGEVATRQDVGFFETPELLAAELVHLAGVKSGDRALEPSAGRGRIVLALQAAGAQVTAVEWLASNQEVLLRDVLKSRDTLASGNDVLLYKPGVRQPKFDRIVMNPPFCKVGLGDHLDHVRKCYGLLRPGGVLVSVLPSSVTFRRDRRHAEFYQWCLDCDGSFEALPDRSFHESGTDVRTVVARIVR